MGTCKKYGETCALHTDCCDYTVINPSTVCAAANWKCRCLKEYEWCMGDGTECCGSLKEVGGECHHSEGTHSISGIYSLEWTVSECGGGAEEYLGNVNSVRDCHDLCVQKKGNTCLYFSFGTKYEAAGKCYWEEECDRVWSDKYYAFKRTSSLLTVIANGDCNSGSEVRIGTTYNTVSECYRACVATKGSCPIFTFGAIGGGRDGECYWEESCSSNTNDAQWIGYRSSGSSAAFPDLSYNIDMDANAPFDNESVFEFNANIIIVIVALILLVVNMVCMVVYQLRKKTYKYEPIEYESETERDVPVEN